MVIVGLRLRLNCKYANRSVHTYHSHSVMVMVGIMVKERIRARI